MVWVQLLNGDVLREIVRLETKHADQVDKKKKKKKKRMLVGEAI